MSANTEPRVPAPVVTVPPIGDPKRDELWKGKWSDGICDCFSDGPSCLLGCLACLFWPLLSPIYAFLKARPLGQVKLLHFKLGLLVFGALYFARLLLVILEQISPYYAGTPWVVSGSRVVLLIPKWYPGFVAISVIVFIIFLIYRTKLRRHYDIPATDGCGDCCLVFWCMPCAITQEYRHVARARGYQDASPADLPPPAVMQYNVAPCVIGTPQPQPQIETFQQSTGGNNQTGAHGVSYV
ncbi:unnamed protein product [Vitrella brassicaformis CCMP3155]|uniref:Uncharacterized protein n=1 Tax=Vitrella brassicaformis (strain CCMP3155) TaxID=1169540 RepID=A0A0G4FTZ0_VITBC|nr:unnamed protein product [Vitrella brassicaformis CCMP3155]|mmetsp:Transcript_48686/g.121875  ORF Transcript_48686/g.121875 Transcript_48686/m.121875 type:complete len:240 (-) Transcript_48686:1126-1845(-)|eukprot:CEM18375.1 unnamed protein product [Vitrella brassicaformis CCMP3155]